MNTEKVEKAPNFLEEIISGDPEVIDNGIVTRFPPEPNGYLHIGHAKSICLNFGLANKFGGKTNLRFDDTNPEAEDVEYVNSIKEDIKWLGFEWNNEFYTSDYFDQLYDLAVLLIKKGLAYIDDSTSEEIAHKKGTPTIPGKENLYRYRSVDDNLDLFTRMRRGEFKDEEKVLRAKIDMASPNMHLRDPLMYRIKHALHHRTKDKWCIYPMYDFAHGQSDAIEKISHSICTLEFESHRPLYEWFIDKLGIFPSHQYEFARLNLAHTVMSKRKLLELVNENHVTGWDDPRMPTISGLRRRGYTPESIREFCDVIGVARRENLITTELLDSCVRKDLNKKAHRVMVVLDPIKVIIDNYTADANEIPLTGDNNPDNPYGGIRTILFSKEIYIERDDFMEVPVKKYFRLGPGLMVRMKNAYIIRCDSYKKDEAGNVTEIHCIYFPESKSGNDTSGISVKGTIHWVDVKTAVPVEVRLYEHLFIVENPALEEDFKKHLNPKSMEIIPVAYAEKYLEDAKPLEKYQFIRKGYFCVDKDSGSKKIIFNRTVSLKDSWPKAK